MTETLYDRVGGEEALHHLEELFYDKALADPVLKTLFTHRVPTHVDHLTWFTAESFGGPDRFTRELGFQYVEFGAQVAQQNSWAASEAELHPIRPRQGCCGARSASRTPSTGGSSCARPPIGGRAREARLAPARHAPGRAASHSATGKHLIPPGWCSC